MKKLIKNNIQTPPTLTENGIIIVNSSIEKEANATPASEDEEVTSQSDVSKGNF